MRVCLDTNVLISAFATRGLSSDLLRLILAQHDLVLPDCVAAEFDRILVDKLGVSDEALASVHEVLARVARTSSPADFNPVGLGDPDDERVLASAVAADVDVLVSGDRDFLDNIDLCPVRILSPRAFWELVRGGAC